MYIASGYTPQAYHKHNKKQFAEHFNEGLILQEIDAIRKHQPGCGGRKLFVMLQPFFTQHNITTGRDKFFVEKEQTAGEKDKTQRTYYDEQTSLPPLSQPGKGFYATEGS